MLEETTERAYTTALLTGDTWEDFVALVEANNGVWGGCWCMGFHPEGLDRTSARHNRENKHSHVRRGTVHQTLVYDGKDCVGWCQYGTPAELPTINNAKAYDKELVELPDWRIGCIFTYLHTGPENLFEELGFTRDRRIAKWRWVMRRHIRS